MSRRALVGAVLSGAAAVVALVCLGQDRKLEEVPGRSPSSGQTERARARSVPTRRAPLAVPEEAPVDRLGRIRLFLYQVDTPADPRPEAYRPTGIRTSVPLDESQSSVRHDPACTHVVLDAGGHRVSLTRADFLASPVRELADSIGSASEELRFDVRELESDQHVESLLVDHRGLPRSGAGCRAAAGWTPIARTCDAWFAASPRRS